MREERKVVVQRRHQETWVPVFFSPGSPVFLGPWGLNLGDPQGAFQSKWSECDASRFVLMGAKDSGGLRAYQRCWKWDRKSGIWVRHSQPLCFLSFLFKCHIICRKPQVQNHSQFTVGLIPFSSQWV